MTDPELNYLSSQIVRNKFSLKSMISRIENRNQSMKHYENSKCNSEVLMPPEGDLNNFKAAQNLNGNKN